MNLINQLLEHFFRKKIYSPFTDNIWGVDLADVQLMSKYNKERIRFLLCGIARFSKYKWIVPLNNKNGLSIVNASQTTLDNSRKKPNKIWIGQGSEFYNNSFKNGLKTII